MDTTHLRRRVEELLRAARAARCVHQQAILVSQAAELLGFAQLEELGQPSERLCTSTPGRVEAALVPDRLRLPARA